MRKHTLLSLVFLAALLAYIHLLAPTANASPAPVHIYLDADMTSAKASTISIERGILTALAEVDNKLAGHPVEVRVLNHRGNSARSLANLKKFLRDPNALVLYSGLHSPPLLAHKQFINENGILTLNPWAAAGPITRPAGDTNWIFRLSVDDSKAGGVIVKRAVDIRGFKKPALLLEQTGWGKSNNKTMTAHLAKRNLAPVTVSWFDWGLKDTGARIILREIKQSGADVIFMVANAPEGKTICKAMNSLTPQERLPIVSHWGITGGDFPQVITKDIRKNLDLEFIQTSYSFVSSKSTPMGEAVFAKMQSLFPEIQSPEDLRAPAGFVHAYDLTKLLIAASKQIPFGGNMQQNRKQLHAALENLKQPVKGLVKTYAPPFQAYSVSNKDAHEALGPTDFTFGRYGDNNEIRLVE